MSAKNFALLIFVLVVAKAQRNTTQPPEIAYPNDELYGLFKIENVTVNNKETCQCEANYSADAPWTMWSMCQSDVSAFPCHRGIRYRSKQCAEGMENFCAITVWRHCYHQASCTGIWIEWRDPNAQCSRPCGGGYQTQVRICRRGPEIPEIGLFCESSQRRPYDLKNVPCNTQPCPGGSLASDVTFLNDSIGQNSSTSQSSVRRSMLEPNFSTWIAAGVGGGLLLIVILTSVCISQRRNGRRNRVTKHISNDENNFEVLNNASGSQNGSPSARETTLSQSNEPNGNIIHSRSNNALGDLPKVPPILHHSFYKGKTVPSQNAVYTLPQSPSSTNFPLTGLKESTFEVSTYMESSTPFCSGDRQASTKDHPAGPIRQPISDFGYLETSSSRNQLIKNESSQLFNTTRRPTVDSIKTSTFGNLQDLTSDQSQISEGPESHIYADIPAAVSVQ